MVQVVSSLANAVSPYSLLRPDVTSPKLLPLKKFIHCLLVMNSGNRFARWVEGKMGKCCWVWVGGGGGGKPLGRRSNLLYHITVTKYFLTHWQSYRESKKLNININSPLKKTVLVLWNSSLYKITLKHRNSKYTACYNKWWSYTSAPFLWYPCIYLLAEFR